MLGMTSTEQTARTYREILFRSPGDAEFISGAIMYDETIRQQSLQRTPYARVLTSQGIFPGIKIDTGAKSFAGFPKETITDGLDGLGDRLKTYRDIGVRFAKWRAVIHVTDTFCLRECQCARVGSVRFPLSGAGQRALQDPTIDAWHGRDEHLAAIQRAFYHRTVGKYTDEMESVSANKDDPPLRRD
jgi:fructose-bisphosphate aldolase class 1